MPSRDKKIPTRPSLTGKHIYLRPMTPEDITNTQHWSAQCDPDALSCRPIPFRTAAEAAAAYQTREITPNMQRFMIVRKKDHLPVGRVVFFDLNNLNRSAELGIIVDPDEHQNGYGTEAIKLLCRYLFKYRGLNKVHLQTAEFNKGMIQTAEKLGFHKDAVLRDHYYYNDEFHAGLIYSLLRFEQDW
jgi:RimJ/RimL family protein N-acetyltransferase